MADFPILNQWIQTVDENGSSITNWTSVVSTWAEVSSAIQGTTSGATDSFIKYNNPVAQSAMVFQADISIASTGGYTGTSIAYLLFGWDGVSHTGSGNGQGA